VATYQRDHAREIPCLTVKHHALALKLLHLN
jgi:hypothetical protein